MYKQIWIKLRGKPDGEICGTTGSHEVNIDGDLGFLENKTAFDFLGLLLERFDRATEEKNLKGR